MPDGDAVLVQEVWKTYGGRRPVRALEHVTLAVGRGEIYGLLGRNGAGKTTLVKILLDIVRADAGTARILGVDSGAPRARQPVGYLPEDHRFPEYRTARQSMDFYSRLSGVPAPERRRRIPELLDRTGLLQAADRKVRGYSKGMKQRLGLAQALVHDPQVLFLDEPTDGVDPVGRAEIRDILVHLREEGKTIFMNSHLLSEVEQICGRVGIIERGELVRQGTIDELTRTEGLWSLRTVPDVDAATQQALQEIAGSVRVTGPVCELTLADEADIDRVIDVLRSRNVGIRAVAIKKRSLEEAFLKALQPQNGDAA